MHAARMSASVSIFDSVPLEFSTQTKSSTTVPVSIPETAPLVPVYPSIAVPEPSSAVTVTVCAAPIWSAVGNPPTLNVTSGTETETVCGFDVLPWKFASPAYTAVNVCDPIVSGGVVQVATPVVELNDTPLQIADPPSLNVIVTVATVLSTPLFALNVKLSAPL